MAATAKAKLAPCELHSTFDLVRVLRPVGTVNKKYATLVSAMVFQPDRRYRIEEFEQHLPRPEPVKAWTPPANATGSIIDRATHYVAHIPGAVSGQGGHDATFSVAMKLVEGFGLSVADAMPIMQGWNTTCTPPWSETSCSTSWRCRRQGRAARLHARRHGCRTTDGRNQNNPACYCRGTMMGDLQVILGTPKRRRARPLAIRRTAARSFLTAFLWNQPNSARSRLGMPCATSASVAIA